MSQRVWGAIPAPYRLPGPALASEFSIPRSPREPAERLRPRREVGGKRGAPWPAERGENPRVFLFPLTPLTLGASGLVYPSTRGGRGRRGRWEEVWLSHPESPGFLARAPRGQKIRGNLRKERARKGSPSQVLSPPSDGTAEDRAEGQPQRR